MKLKVTTWTNLLFELAEEASPFHVDTSLALLGAAHFLLGAAHLLTSVSDIIVNLLDLVYSVLLPTAVPKFLFDL